MLGSQHKTFAEPPPPLLSDTHFVPFCATPGQPRSPHALPEEGQLPDAQGVLPLLLLQAGLDLPLLLRYQLLLLQDVRRRLGRFGLRDAEPAAGLPWAGGGWKKEKKTGQLALGAA